jgi:hypothetical protein
VLSIQHDGPILERRRVLQQLWVDQMGRKQEWRDIPEVSAEEAARGQKTE